MSQRKIRALQIQTHRRLLLQMQRLWELVRRRRVQLSFPGDTVQEQSLRVDNGIRRMQRRVQVLPRCRWQDNAPSVGHRLQRILRRHRRRHRVPRRNWRTTATEMWRWRAAQSQTSMNKISTLMRISRRLHEKEKAVFTAAQAAAGSSSNPPRMTNVFSLVEKFTFRPSPSENATSSPPLLPPEIQYWAGVIMRNACRKDESRGGIRQCANSE